MGQNDSIIQHCQQKVVLDKELRFLLVVMTNQQVMLMLLRAGYNEC